jgi:hypothetical protein
MDCYSSQSGQNSCDPFSTNKKLGVSGRMAQVVECLPSKCIRPSIQNPSTTKKNQYGGTHLSPHLYRKNKWEDCGTGQLCGWGENMRTLFKK